jgi:hypothetical protein
MCNLKRFKDNGGLILKWTLKKEVAKCEHSDLDQETVYIFVHCSDY